MEVRRITLSIATLMSLDAYSASATNCNCQGGGGLIHTWEMGLSKRVQNKEVISYIEKMAVIERTSRSTS
jgi:hypothetical protein